MKGIKAVAGVVMLVCVVSFAGVGIQAGGGVNFSNLYRTGGYKTSIQDNRTLTGVTVSWLYWVTFNEKMGALAGLSYESRGTANYDYLQKTISLGYVEIPLLFSYRILPELEARVGPEVGVLTSARGRDENYAVGTGIKDVFQKTDIGISLNLCYTLFDRVVVGAGYDFGILNAMNNSKTGMGGSMHNSSLAITISYKYTAQPTAEELKGK
jgi:hypothetical protein